MANKQIARQLIRLAACTLALLAATSCASDDAVQDEKQGKDNVPAEMTVFEGEARPNVSTRTAIVDHTQGSGAKVNWSATDKIWVKDNSGTWRQSGVATFPTTANKSYAKFALTGTYGNPTHEVIYANKAASGTPLVEIKAHQSQSAPNNFDHAGISGDCGVATATKNATGKYHFSLDHKAVYLCLLPRSTNSLIRDFVIQRVTVIADNDIAGDYTLSASGLSSTPMANGSKSIEITVPNLPLTNATSLASNAIYVVMAPQTTALNIVYHLFNPTTNMKGTVTKNIATATYSEGKFYDITANLGTDYTAEIKPYLWDAKQWVFYNQTEPYNLSSV